MGGAGTGSRPIRPATRHLALPCPAATATAGLPGSQAAAGEAPGQQLTVRDCLPQLQSNSNARAPLPRCRAAKVAGAAGSSGKVLSGRPIQPIGSLNPYNNNWTIKAKARHIPWYNRS